MNNFTEQDLQDYFDGSFTGNEKALLDFVDRDAEWKFRFEAYRALYGFLQKDEQEFKIPGLPEKLLVKLQKKEEKKARLLSRLLMYALLLVVGTGCIYCTQLLNWNQIVSGTDTLLVIIMALITGAFLYHSYRMELKQLKKKYSL